MLLLIGLVNSITDKQIIQLLLNGIYQENKLPQPVTIVPCIDDVSAHKIVIFIGQLLDKAGKGSLNDLLSLPKLIKDFGNQIDPEVGNCLDGNEQVEKLKTVYNPKNQSGSQVQKRIIQYVTLHYFQVHKWLGDLDNLWKKGQPYQTGFNMAGYLHNILKSSVVYTQVTIKSTYFSKYRRWY